MSDTVAGEINALSRDALIELRRLDRQGRICWRGHIHASKEESRNCLFIGCDLGHMHADPDERDRCHRYQREFMWGSKYLRSEEYRFEDALSWRLYNDPEFNSIFTASVKAIADGGLTGIL